METIGRDCFVCCFCVIVVGVLVVCLSGQRWRLRRVALEHLLGGCVVCMEWLQRVNPESSSTGLGS